MSERFTNRMEKYLGDQVTDAFAKELSKAPGESQRQKAQHLFKSHLEFVGIELKHSTTGPESLPEMREKLKTEPGLLISNHPGSFETPALINMLERDDFTFWIADDNYEIIAPVIGDEHIVSIDAKSPNSLKKAFAKTEEHIGKGGLTLMFPSAGKEEGGKVLSFRSGFRHMIQKLKPTDMVYCAYLNPDDLFDFKLGETKMLTFLASHKSGFALPVSKTRHTMRLQEHYTQASEWQALLTDNKKADNYALTAHFKSLFTSEPQTKP